MSADPNAHIAGGSTVAGDMYSNKTAVTESVQNYYGKVLSKSTDLKTSACTASGAPPPALLRCLAKVPQVVKDKFYGCGNPIPTGIDGLTILDLGCGSGRDCFVAAQLAGPKGKVIGLDMTPAQLVVAEENTPEFEAAAPGSSKLEWRAGYIEDIIGSGVTKGSCQMVISNCVVNLSPDKPAVLQGAFDALSEGGEMYFSDVYVDRRLSEEIRMHKVLFGECLSGALYERDFCAMAQKIGFAPPMVLSRADIDVHDESLRDILGNSNFWSVTYRLFKLPKESVDHHEEDYGHVALYNGGILGHTRNYQLNETHNFEVSRPMRVSGNTAAALSSPSWLARYFTVHGNRSKHFGAFAPAGSGAQANTSGPRLPKDPLPSDDLDDCGG